MSAVGVAAARSRAWSATELADALGQPHPTPEQRAVIEAPLRPTLVVAGAGSGKTETMAARVVWLVANGHVEPDEVLGLTFTRKAAAELSERLSARLALLADRGVWQPRREEGAEVLGGTPTVSTYHAYAGRLVSEHGLRLGVEPDTRLLTEAAAWQVAHEAVVSYDGAMDAVSKAPSTITAAVLDLAGELAEHLVDLPRVEQHLLDVEAAYAALCQGDGRAKGPSTDLRTALDALRERRAILPIVARYTELKRRRGAMDFADQIALAARVAQQVPAAGPTERARYRAVLLDEFQDTSVAQLTFLRTLFVAPGRPVVVTAVGDPHQAIYGWRGASAATLDHFRDGFVDARGPADVLHLSVSWRNDARVLEAANHVARPLARDATVPVKPLVARPQAGPGRVALARLETLETEADHVARWLVEQRARADVETSAVLCRKRSQFDPVIAALEAHGLPYEVVGLGGLLLVPEVVDLVALLWVIQDPTRGDHLMRLLTGPSCRLGAADLDGLHTWARARQHHPDLARPQTDLAPASRERPSIVEALDDLPDPAWRGPAGQRVAPVALERLAALGRVLRRLRALTALPLPDLVGEAERALGLDIEVLARAAYTPAAARAHLDAFADVATHFAASAERPTLGGFLDWLDAAIEEERGLDLGWLETSPDAVQVMTVHAAKGLEWDAVAVPGMVEASFPAHGAKQTSVRDGQWATSEVKDKGWLTGLGTLPHDLRGDAAALPRLDWRGAQTWDEARAAYDRYVGAGAEHAIAEERRLAYVALTRARHALLLTAPVWASAGSPRVTSRFLEEVRALEGPSAPQVDPWCPMPPTDDDSVANPRLAEGLSASWPAVPEPSPALREAGEQVSRYAAALASAADPTPGPWDDTVALLLHERAARRSRGADPVEVPGHLSTSQLVRLAGDPEQFVAALRRPMPEPPAVAARRGTAFHRWVEQHYARAAIVDVLELPGSADDDQADDGDLPVMRERFLASPWAQRTPVEVETALETVIDGIAVRGRVDAVFADGDGWVVVDWKTGARPREQVARVRALQLAAYRLAWARLRQVPLARVRAAFYYAATGETVWPELVGEEGLVEVLSTLAPPP